MTKPICPHCEDEIDEINEDTGEYAIWGWDEKMERFVYKRDEHADSTTFYCPHCHNKIDVDIEDNKVKISKVQNE